MLSSTSAIEDRPAAPALRRPVSLPLEIPRSSLPYPPAGRVVKSSRTDRLRPYGMAPVPPPRSPAAAGVQNEEWTGQQSAAGETGDRAASQPGSLDAAHDPA
jgi:hypothetical protein